MSLGNAKGTLWTLGAWTRLLLAAALVGCSSGKRDPSDVGGPVRPDVSRLPAAFAIELDTAGDAVVQSPDDAQAWLKLGMLYHANGYPAEAQVCYERVADSGSGNPRVSYYLARLRESASDLAAEQAWLRETLNAGPDYVPARLLLADTLVKSGDADAGLVQYRAVLQSDPDNPDALVALARAAIRDGDDEQARRILQGVCAKRPNYVAAFALLAPLLDRQGDSSGAEVARIKSRSGRTPDPADPWYDELMEFCFDTQQLRMRFENFTKSGAKESALNSLRRIEALDPENPLVLQMRGLAAVSAGRYADALKAYQQALDSGAEPGRTYASIVAVLTRMHRFPEAEREAQAGLRKAPGDPDLLVAIAELRMARNDAAGALRALNQALEAAPENVDANRALAAFYFQSGNEDKAAQRLQVIERVAPGDISSRAQLGQYYLNTGALERAVETLEPAVALEPDDVQLGDLLTVALLRLGNAAAKNGRIDEAVTRYDSASALRPDMAEIYANKAQVLMQSNRPREAEAPMQQLARLRPENAAVFLSLGDLQRAAGKPDEARASWSAALRLLGEGGDRAMRSGLNERLNALETQ